MADAAHIILGTGPVGCWTARSLRELGLPVRAVNRSGKRPHLLPADVEVVAADLSDAARATSAAAGAAVVYQALNPAYDKWPKLFPPLQRAALAAAKAAGARYVSIENLYMYDSSRPMTEDSLVKPRSKKGELRARMAAEVMAAHECGDVRAAALRSADYYGSGVTASAFGDRVFPNLLAGKKAQVIGSASTPHSFAYIEDVGRAAATLGTRDEALGSVWIAPHAQPLTQGAMVEKAGRSLGVQPRISVLSPLIMRIGGLFIPAAREGVEMMYEFTEPFVVDSSRIEGAFGLQPTPVDDAMARTAGWYKARG